MRAGVHVRRDLLLAALADVQDAQVSRAQLLAIGFSASAITRRVHRRYLRPVYPGVYSVGHPPRAREQWWWAALLRGGNESALSGCPAAVHHGLLRFCGLPEIISPRHMRQPGIISHRGVVALDEITVVEGIRVTTAARTMIDIAATESDSALGYALNQIEVRRLYDETGLQVLLARHTGRRGVGRLRRLTPDRDDLRSEMERRLRREVRRLGLPKPRYNAPLALPGHFATIDALWEEPRVAVELDSRTWHDTPAQFEEDRRRDRALRRGGFLPVRLTWRQWEDGIAEVRELVS